MLSIQAARGSSAGSPGIRCVALPALRRTSAEPQSANAPRIAAPLAHAASVPHEQTVGTGTEAMKIGMASTERTPVAPLGCVLDGVVGSAIAAAT